jgi:hypothetical protein
VKKDFGSLKAYLRRVPAVEPLSSGAVDGGGWWLKLRIDVTHALAWRVVQELGHVLNYVSLEERLPTRFMPVSPPPYLNGGPEDFLSWVIECDDPKFGPAKCRAWLWGRLPRPVAQARSWEL